MSSKKRLFPSFLLTALVLSWGTCPCVLARALGFGPTPAEAASPEGVETQAEVPAEAPGACRCCKRHASRKHSEGQPDEGRQPSRPDDCPCCSRGGSIRDLPPEGGDALQDGPPEVVALALVESDLGAPPVPLRCPAEKAATGPPPEDGLHGCPVGIVLILS